MEKFPLQGQVLKEQTRAQAKMESDASAHADHQLSTDGLISYENYLDGSYLESNLEPFKVWAPIEEKIYDEWIKSAPLPLK